MKVKELIEKLLKSCNQEMEIGLLREQMDGYSPKSYSCDKDIAIELYEDDNHEPFYGIY